MELQLLLTHLSAQGVKLSVEKDSLLIDAPQGSITPELRDALIEHKSELLLLLHQSRESASSESLPQIKPDPTHRHEPFPLTEMQYAYWVGRSGVLELGTVANHGYYEIDCEHLALDRFNQALLRLIDRHDMLRAIVLPDGQQQVLQQVPPYEIQVFDLRGQQPETIDAHLGAIREQLSHQVLPSDRFPLFEFCATRLDHIRTRLHVSYDLQIFDAWSLFRLFDEWFQLYQQPELQLPPLEISFRDYVLTEQTLGQTELFQRSRAYWLNRLDTLPPVPDLPLAKQPKELKQHRCQRYDGELNAEQWRQLKQRAAKAGLTPSGVLLAAFTEVISQWSKIPRYTLNLALFNRLPLHPQVNDLLGDFTSVILLAVDHTVGESFVDRAKQLQRQLWQDLEHHYVSGVEVTRELARHRGTPPSTIPVVFTSTLGFGALGQETLTFSHFGKLVYGISQASQTWIDVQVWEDKGRLTCNWDVVEALFPDKLIQDMVDSYWHLLQQLAASEAAWLETTRSRIPPTQLAQINAINATAAAIPDTALLQTLFFEQVPRRSQQTAVVTRNRSLSYQELYDRVCTVGHQLRALGAQPNELIAVVMEKGWEQVVATLGILTAGAAYAPIDPELPTERQWQLLKQSETRWILSQSKFESTLTFPEGLQPLWVDQIEPTPASPTPAVIQSPHDLAYVIYTSGSTGLPKGVMIDHRGAVNTILDINQRFQVNPGDRIFALSALNFDLSVYDLFGALAAGATIVIPETIGRKDPVHWLQLMQQHQVTIWNSVPALMQMLVEYLNGTRQQTSGNDSLATTTANRVQQTPPPPLVPLRLALLSGDWIPLSLPDQIRRLFPGTDLISLGGATEVSIWSILYPIEEVDPTWKSIPYGRPLMNQQFHVLNEALEPCPIWVPGQLYIGGMGLARGYWRDEVKTGASFITHPRTGERLYRTGDLGRYLDDGNIEFLGREDFQVKINGYRVELGEIETVLEQHPSVQTAVVSTVGATREEQRLVAHVIPVADAVATASATASLIPVWRSFLQSRLPDYMIPVAFLTLETLPLTANGKVDRRILTVQAATLQMPETTYIAPQNEFEQTIATVWRNVLNLDRISVHDNFFDIGGNSLLITKAYSELKSLLPQNVTSWALTDLFKYPTIYTFAAYLHLDSQSIPQTSEEFSQKLQDGKSRLKQQLSKSLSIR